MNKLIDEKQGKFKKMSNLSKNDIIKKFSYIKISKTSRPKLNKEYNKNKIIEKKYLGKKNLTCLNFFNFKQKYRKRISLQSKINHDLIIDSDYSSFISKNSFPITGLVSPKRIKSNIRFNRFYTGKQRYLDYSNIRTKSSSSKNTKSNNINYNSTFLKNDAIILSKTRLKSSKSNINIIFNEKMHNVLLKSSLSKYGRENVLSFLEKTRIIRREKVNKVSLDDKIMSETELNKEKFNKIDRSKGEFLNNLILLNKFEKSFNDYLKNLELKKITERQICNDLIRQKIELQNINQNLIKKINRLKIIVKKYKNIKDFLVSVKNGYESIKNRRNGKINKNDLTLLLKRNEEKKEQKIGTNNQKAINDQIKPKLSIFNRQGSLKNKKFYFQKKYSINKINTNSKINSINNSNSRNNDNQLKKTYTFLNKRDSNSSLDDNNNLPIFESVYEFIHVFINFENFIVNDINYLNNHKLSINELKRNLEQVEKEEKIDEKESNYYNIMISTKIKMLDFLKKENLLLKNKLNSLTKIKSTNKNIKNNLEKKIFDILKIIDIKLNFEEKEKFEIKNLFNLLELDSKDFFKKKHLSKILYMIKTIDLIALYKINLINKYKIDPKLKEIYKNYMIIFEKEKNDELHNLIKQQIKQDLEEKKINSLKKSNKIRFLSSRKFDVRNPNDKRYIINRNKKTILKRNIPHEISDNFEQWMSYG